MKGLRLVAFVVLTAVLVACPQTKPPTLGEELDAYVPQAMQVEGVQGAAVAVIRDGAVVYQKAFGVKRQGGGPVGPGTHFMIGSTGKSLTTMLMAGLVDAGKAAWTTPAQQILPQFELIDPALSPKVTFQDLVCQCTGVPRRDLQFLLGGESLTPEKVVESVRNYPLDGPFGKTFAYSNQMVAIGGFAAAKAAGQGGDWLEGYAAELAARVLNPVGMPDTTLSFAAVEARADYAQPHGLSIEAEQTAIPLAYESVLSPIGPAGAHWSTLEDMTRYLRTQMAGGVAPDGTRVVSSANLAETWKPRVTIEQGVDYALGWIVAEYRGQKLIFHGGNTLGFSALLAFLPESGLGVVVLASGQGLLFNTAVQMRVLEIVFDQRREFDRIFRDEVGKMQQQYKQVAAQLKPVQPEAVNPYLGRYGHPELGTLELSLEGDALRVDTGAIVTHAKRYQAMGQVYYLTTDAGLAGVPLQLRMEGGQPVVVLPAPEGEYVFTRAARAQAALRQPLEPLPAELRALLELRLTPQARAWKLITTR